MASDESWRQALAESEVDRLTRELDLARDVIRHHRDDAGTWT